MKTRIFLTIFFLFSLRIGTDASPCSIDTSPFMNLSITYPSISSENETIAGITYGKIISIPNTTWLLSEFSISKNATKISSACPNGWLPPSKEDLQDLMSYALQNSSNLTILTQYFGMKSSMYYASNTKVNPDNFNSSDANAYKYYGIKLIYSTTQDLFTASLSIFSAVFQTSSAKLFCVYANKTINNNLTSQPVVNISGLSKKDFIKGIQYNINIISTNIVNVLWEIDNQSVMSKNLSMIPMKYGKFQIKVRALFFDGTVLGKCFNVWVRNYTGSEANTTLSLQDIHQVQYNNSNVYRSFTIHFSSGSAPLAPIDTGGAYIIYAKTNENMALYVKTIDNDGQQLSEISLNKTGYPMDLIAVDWGFVTLIIDVPDGNTLYLLGYDTTKNQTAFTRIIMDNGDQPLTFNQNQLIFYKNSSGAAMFGMEAMYEPSTGKLLFAKDRIVCIFAHYNHFGMVDGQRNDHTGDTLVSFNLSGKDEKLSFSWGASHSMAQSLAYNGDSAIMSSLGDAYPINLRFVNSEVEESNGNVDPYTGLEDFLDYQVNQSLLEGTIPGNGQGNSCGRIGTISVFADEGVNTISYSRRSCENINLSGYLKSSNISEMGLAFFSDDLQRVNDVDLGDGKYVNQVQSVKYGNHIFYSFVSTTRETSDSNYLSSYIDSSTDVMTVMLLDSNGTVVDGPFNLTKAVMPASDEMRVLSDGRVAWSFVDDNNKLNYYYLSKPPTTLTNLELVQASEYYSGENFYFVSDKDKNIYKTTLGGSFIAFNKTDNNTSDNSSTSTNTTENNTNDNSTSNTSENVTNNNSIDNSSSSINTTENVTNNNSIDNSSSSINTTENVTNNNSIDNSSSANNTTENTTNNNSNNSENITNTNNSENNSENTTNNSSNNISQNNTNNNQTSENITKNETSINTTNNNTNNESNPNATNTSNENTTNNIINSENTTNSSSNNSNYNISENSTDNSTENKSNDQINIQNTTNNSEMSNATDNNETSNNNSDLSPETNETLNFDNETNAVNNSSENSTIETNDSTENEINNNSIDSNSSSTNYNVTISNTTNGTKNSSNQGTSLKKLIFSISSLLISLALIFL